MKKYFVSGCCSIVLSCLCNLLYAQNIGVGTSAPHPSAQMDVNSTRQGILIPRMSIPTAAAINRPARGLMIYDTATNQLVVNMGSADAPNWQNIVTSTGWGVNGNKIKGGNAFIGTTDNASLAFRVSNSASGLIDSASMNTFFGWRFGPINPSSQNTAIGSSSLEEIQLASSNIAFGSAAQINNFQGSSNIGVGWQSLFANTSANNNVGIGVDALSSTTTPSNVAVGFAAMGGNSMGTGNVAIGFEALSSTTNSSRNTVVGANSGNINDLGDDNTLLGANINMSTDGLSNTVGIGQDITITASNSARIGNSATSSIGGFVDWTNFSDGRFKKDMKEDVKGLDFITRLRPVTYHLDIEGIQRKISGDRITKSAAVGKPNLPRMKTAVKTTDAGFVPDASMQSSLAKRAQTVFSGFAAQEVDKAAQDAGYDFSGVDKPSDENNFYGLRYEDFVVPLVKAVQEQQQIIDRLQKKIDTMEQKLAARKAAVH